MFMQAPNSNSIVNLNQVTHLTKIDSKKRVIFNFNNVINVNDLQVADYLYINCNNSDEFNFFWNNVVDYIEKDGWLISSNPTNHPINPYYISSINVDELKNKIIFNLSKSVTKIIKKENIDKRILVSEFVFWEFPTKLSFEKEYNKVIRTLGV